MLRFLVVRPKDTVIVYLMKNKYEETGSFVNITKSHICPCKFNSIEEGIDDLERYKKEGKVKYYTRLSDDPVGESYENK